MKYLSPNCCKTITCLKRRIIIRKEIKKWVIESSELFSVKFPFYKKSYWNFHINFLFLYYCFMFFFCFSSFFMSHWPGGDYPGVRRYAQTRNALMASCCTTRLSTEGDERVRWMQPGLASQEVSINRVVLRWRRGAGGIKIKRLLWINGGTHWWQKFWNVGEMKFSVFLY